MARIALVGASGNIGSCVLREALSRSHQVVGIVRNTEKLTAQPGLTIAKADLADPASVAQAAKGADALVVSLRWSDNAAQVMEAARLAGISRVLVVVGAGSLEASPGVRVLDTPEFPAAWRPGAEGAARALASFRNEKQLDWVAFSPSWTIAPGERTNKFRMGGDQLLRDAAGESRISREDFAVAIVNEVEAKQYHRQRVTVGY
ncbi:MAG TPA: NAD(P)-dependent oxidoreductase [Steroidobacteraceae bacterium]|nr:NAD(P)-dependent oxidoreductase [Steroidobacteraceae bacterium]